MSKPVVKQLAVGPMLNLAYIVGDADAGLCAVIDPGWDSQSILDAAKDLELKIEKILLTHAHFDHAGAVGDIAKETGAAIYVHTSETPKSGDELTFVQTSDGDVIDLGSLKIECVHTPGHTPGSQCFLVGGNLFTGDTLFIDGCGRVDLPESNPGQMLKSLGRISKLDPTLKVWPGHDYGGLTATMGELVETNPYLGVVDEDSLL